MDFRGLPRAAQFRREEHVIDPPSHVARSRVREVTPPRVVPVTLGEHAESIDEAGVHHVLEAFALLIRKALLTAIRLRIRQVQLRVGDIQIATEDDRLFLLELFAIGQERRVPVLESQWQAAEVVLRVRGIDRDHVEIFEFRGDDAAFLGAVPLQLVSELEALRESFRKAVDHLQRLLPGENGRTRIALLHRRIPVLVVAGHLDLDLPPFGLGLLQAQDVWLMSGHERLERAFFQRGTDPIDVPGVDFHGLKSTAAPRAGPNGSAYLSGERPGTLTERQMGSTKPPALRSVQLVWPVLPHCAEFARGFPYDEAA